MNHCQQDIYAEAYHELDNCYSKNRTGVALIETPFPSLTILSKACLNDLSSYTLRFSTDALLVSANQGTLEKLVGLEWMVTGIPADTAVELVLTNDVSLCSRIESIESPDCECQLVSEPITGGSKLICFGDEIPSLSVSLIQEGMTADWYTSIGGSTPLVTGQLEYTPQNIIGTGVYTYYAQARSLENGCTSTMRTAIELTVLDPPVYAFIDTDCSEDLKTYTATIYSDATSMEADNGDVIIEGNGVMRIVNVPIQSNIFLSIVSPAGCVIIKEIFAPSCDCQNVEAPICKGLINTCEGSDYDGFLSLYLPIMK